MGFPDGTMGENPPANAETREMRVRSLDREEALKEEMETHSSFLAWRISWTEEPGGPHSVKLRKNQTGLSAQATFTQLVTGAPKMAIWWRQMISDGYQLKVFFFPPLKTTLHDTDELVTILN